MKVRMEKADRHAGASANVVERETFRTNSIGVRVD